MSKSTILNATCNGDFSKFKSQDPDLTGAIAWGFGNIPPETLDKFERSHRYHG